MAKLVKQIKLQIEAGKATAAPPVGTVLGPAGVNIGEFVNQFNERTKELAGNVIPVLMNVYDDRSFDFILKQPPASRLLLKKVGKDKGSGKAPSGKVGKLTQAELAEVAEQKMPDLNTEDVEEAKKIMAGTARSMGIEIEK